MRKFLLISFVLLSIPTIQAQDTVISIQYSITEVDEAFSTDKVFHKKTGKRLTQREFKKLVDANPNLHLIKEYDEKGNVVKYIYDPNAQKSKSAPRTTKVPTMGQPFPAFKLKTIANTDLDLDELRGKLIVLRFEMEAGTFRFKKHEIEELDAKINALDDPDKVAAIIIFRTGKNQVLQGFDLPDSNFHLVANGSNLMGKFNIKRFPKTLVIDPAGNLAGEFSYSEDIVLENYLKD